VKVEISSLCTLITQCLIFLYIYFLSSNFSPQKYTNLSFVLSNYLVSISCPPSLISTPPPAFRCAEVKGDEPELESVPQAQREEVVKQSLSMESSLGSNFTPEVCTKK
jgi:hypothetical protein